VQDAGLPDVDPLRPTVQPVIYLGLPLVSNWVGGPAPMSGLLAHCARSIATYPTTPPRVPRVAPSCRQDALAAATGWSRAAPIARSILPKTSESGSFRALWPPCLGLISALFLGTGALSGGCCEQKGEGAQAPPALGRIFTTPPLFGAWFHRR
jgi:hypothetical protein